MDHRLGQAGFVCHADRRTPQFYHRDTRLNPLDPLCRMHGSREGQEDRNEDHRREGSLSAVPAGSAVLEDEPVADRGSSGVGRRRCRLRLRRRRQGRGRGRQRPHARASDWSDAGRHVRHIQRVGRPLLPVHPLRAKGHRRHGPERNRPRAVGRPGEGRESARPRAHRPAHQGSDYRLRDRRRP